MAYITKRCDKWFAEVCIDKKRKSKTFALKKDAVSWSNEQEGGGFLPSHTLKDAIKRYMPIVESHKGYQSEVSRLNHLAASDLGDMRLERLTAAKITEYRDKRLSEVSPVSVRRELIILSSIFNIAVNEWQWLRENPVKTVKKPIAAPARRRGITQTEIDAISINLDAMRSGPQVKTMFELAIETGMRLGELLSVRWSDVGEKKITLPETKNGDRRDVPLSQKARHLVSSRKDIDPVSLFTLSQHVASQTFRRASINGVHFHDSRSEAITRLSKKLDILQLARVIGHRDVRSLMFYYAEPADLIADAIQ